MKQRLTDKNNNVLEIDYETGTITLLYGPGENYGKSTPMGTIKVGVSILQLDAALADVNTSNTVVATGPTFGATTDDFLVYKATGTGTDGWEQVALGSGGDSYFTKTANDAYIGGDQTGNARGDNALDVQSGRRFPDEVASGGEATTVGYGNTASGVYNSSAVGYINTASGYFGASAVGSVNRALGNGASAFGYNNTASGSASTSAFGYGNTASGGSGASAFGYDNAASANSASAFGYQNTASGDYSSAFGCRVKTTVDNTFETGYWAGFSTRGSSIRAHPNGQIALTIEDSGTAPTDGGATAGSEADGTLPRSMYAIQKNGTSVTLYYNNGGTIQSLSLGTLT